MMTYSENAYAYLDPGTGSVVIQAIVGGVLGGLFVLKMYWHKFIGFFKKSDSSKNSDSE